MSDFKPITTTIRWEVRYKVKQTGLLLISYCELRHQARHLKNTIKNSLWEVYDQVQIYRVEEQTFRDDSMIALIEKAR